MSAFVFQPIDFFFDFSATNINVGEVVRTGQTTSYGWRHHNTTGTQPFRTDNETFGEVAGIEIYGPYSGPYVEKLKYVRVIVEGHEHDFQSFNEQMAPMYSGNGLDPLGAAGLRYGTAAINFGMPMLMGGKAWEATPKIGPNQDLEIAVAIPRAAEGGTATINTPMWVRVWLAQVKGEKKLIELLKMHGHIKANGAVDCSFEVGDPEVTEDIPITPIAKDVPDDGPFTGDDWVRVLGGYSADKPNVENFIVYGQNEVATTTNEWYQMTMSGNRVSESWQELEFEDTKETIHKIERIGIKSHTNLKQVRFYRSNRNIESIYDCHPGFNPFPLPQGRMCTDKHAIGMVKLPKPFWVINEIGSIQFKDNGTSVDAWDLSEMTAARTRGFLCAVMGKKIELKSGML